AEAGLLLPGAVAPFAQGAGFRELPGPGGAALTTRDRASCCLYYTLRPEDTCVTCPRTCDAERIERMTVVR
ncbi:iron-sulfur protein, partial [Streptomyces nanshensis]